MPSLLDKLFNRKPAAEPQAVPTEPPAPKPSVDQFDVLYAKAIAAAETHAFDRALEYYDQAIAVDPSRAEPHYKRANALRNVGRLEEAIAGYDDAIARKPDYAYAYCNRGVVQKSLGMFEAALASFDKAAALDPTDTLVPYNRALLLQEQGRWEEALGSYDQAIAIDPGHADAHFNRAMAQLFRGDFANGWRGFEWRWKNAARLGIGAPSSFSEPLWLGEQPLAGKRLLLQSEQGLGDTLQFCRYATLCAVQGATVILEVQPALVELLRTLQGVSQVIAKGTPLPAFDYHCPLLSLPLAFGTTLDTIPAAPKYLSTDAVKVAQWREALGARSRPRVGLVWSGNPNNLIDTRRSIPLSQWVPHLPREFHYFCLQNEVRAADQATLAAHPFIMSVGDFPNFASTASFCECLDIVVCVDTSVAHLCAALGQRTWMLLPCVPDWRWMRDREDSPWYPSMRLYRQSVAGDWEGVFRRVASDLRRELSKA
jgi:Flp pilus assembly protein TadD